LAVPGTSEREARLIARYLIGEEPLPGEIERWQRAVEVRHAALVGPRDERLWALAMRSGWMLGLIDSGLALADAHSPIRHRLLLMLAVLEASPTHVRKFDSPAYPRVSLVFLGLRMAGAALRSAAGVVLVRALELVWR
jgi:hypothetical protein